HEGRPVFAREGRLLVSSFHPELTPDDRVHRYFVELIRAAK
ncbi:MAG TPA: pyridoxal 5'-phosphate synthase glutaminase subunit PdxT, partial [bacterium]